MIGVMGREAHRIYRCQAYRDLKLCHRHPIAHSVRPDPVKWGHRLDEAIAGYATGIIRLIGESYGQHTVQRAWKDFNIDQGRPAFTGYDANAELFYSWLFHKWTPAREEGHELRDEALYGIPPTRAYLDRFSVSLRPLLRTYLEACLTTSPSFYEVVDCEAGLSFHARDVCTGSACTVSETLASTSLNKGDILYAHLIPIGRITVMDAISPQSFPPQSKRRLLQLCQERPAREQGGREFRQIYFTLSAAAVR